MKPSIHIAVHALLVVVMPPLLLGVIARIKALVAGRHGPPFLQPYWDILKLLRKDSVFSETTSWIFRASPVVSVVTALFASALLPLGNHAAPVSFAGDLVLFAYLFALARFFSVSAALDTGSAFEGMGAARDATFACLAEPALFMGLLVLVKRSGALTLTKMLGVGVAGWWQGAGASLVLVVVSLFVVLLAESCRIPFDDPNTHLELTMIHEVMVLDHGGPALGLIQYGAALKLFVLGAVVVRLAVPSAANPWVDWALFAGGMVVLAVAIGVVESVMARLRMRQVPGLLVAACLLSGFGIVLLAR